MEGTKWESEGEVDCGLVMLGETVGIWDTEGEEVGEIVEDGKISKEGMDLGKTSWLEQKGVEEIECGEE